MVALFRVVVPASMLIVATLQHHERSKNPELSAALSRKEALQP